MPSSKITSGKNAQIVKQGHTESLYGSNTKQPYQYKNSQPKELSPK